MTNCIVFDFDGCIHRYSKGWQSGEIYDPVDVRGIRIAQSHGFAAAVLTARDPEPVAQALREHGLLVQEDPDMTVCFWNSTDVVLITNRKIAAVAYLDDRAIRHAYGMSWTASLEEAQRLAKISDGWHPVRPRSCPACQSPGVPLHGCQNLWHIEVRP